MAAKQAAGIVQRAEARIDRARQVINILAQEIDESQFVIEAVQDGSILY